MNRYRYPGTIQAPSYCNNNKQCNPRIIKVCPPAPYIQRSACRANISDRAIVRYINNNCTVKCDSKFVLETFSGHVLLPTNLDQFCGFDFKDGEIVAVEAEDLSSIMCSDDVKINAIPVKLFKLVRTWSGVIKELFGVVSKEVDSLGLEYYMVTETTDLTLSDPYFRMVQNRLLFDKIIIKYEIFNIMGEEDAIQTAESLIGKIIRATYVNYGKETKKRVGAPVVITDFEIVE